MTGRRRRAGERPGPHRRHCLRRGGSFPSVGDEDEPPSWTCHCARRARRFRRAAGPASADHRERTGHLSPRSYVGGERRLRGRSPTPLSVFGDEAHRRTPRRSRDTRVAHCRQCHRSRWRVPARALQERIMSRADTDTAAAADRSIANPDPNHRRHRCLAMVADT